MTTYQSFDDYRNSEEYTFLVLSDYKTPSKLHFSDGSIYYNGLIINDDVQVTSNSIIKNCFITGQVKIDANSTNIVIKDCRIIKGISFEQGKHSKISFENLRIGY